MPTIFTTLDEVDQSMIRPSIIDVTSQVREVLRMDQNTPILFPGMSGVSKQPGSLLDDTNTQSKLSHQSYIAIEPSYNYSREDIGSMAVTYADQQVIFKDTSTGVFIRPVYAKTNVTIAFNYYSKSKTEGMRWRDDIALHAAHGRDVLLHKLHYHYLVPESLIELLRHIHSLREAQAPYGDTFGQYLEAHGTGHFTAVTDTVGQAARLAVKETQSRLIGQFDFAPTPEEIKKEDNALWLNTFSYTFAMDVPIGITMYYPVVVHNQMLDPKYINFYNDNPNNIYDSSVYFNTSFKAFNHFEVTELYGTRLSQNRVIQYPPQDVFNPKTKVNDTLDIMTLLVTIEPNDLRTLLDLNDLDPFELDREVINYLKRDEYRYATKPFQSIFLFSLYQDDTLINSDNLHLSEDLVLSTTADLNLRRRYHVRFSVVSNPTLLSDSVVRRLQKNRALVYFYLASIYTHVFLESWFFKRLMEKTIDTPLTDNEFLSMQYWLNFGSDPRYEASLGGQGGRSNFGPGNTIKARGQQTTIRSVMTSWVIALRKEN